MGALRAPLRAALLQTLWPPTAQRPRVDGGPVPPGDWVPIQQVPGWSFNYAIPLPAGTTDTGSSWVGHREITDQLSCILLNLNVSAPSMPESFPMRIRVPTWTDTVSGSPGTPVLPSQVGINPGPTFNNPNPPTTEFAGQPFEFICYPNQQGGEDGYTQWGFGYARPIFDADAGDATVALEFSLEYQDQGGVWHFVQDGPGIVVDDLGNLTDTGTTFTVSGPISTLVSVRYHTQHLDLATVPVRFKVLNYVVVPDPEAPATSVVDPGAFYTNDSVGGNRHDFNTSTAFPPTMDTALHTVTQETTHQPDVPPTSYTFALQALECVYDNLGTFPQEVDFEIAVEVQLPP